MAEVLLTVDGEVEHPLHLSFEDFQKFDAKDHVKDVSRFCSTRQGDGITLNSLLERVKTKPSGTYLTLHATADDFAASLPLSAVRDEGIIVFQVNGERLPASLGGPIRFLIRDSAACHTAELDDCANVKFIDRIELTAGKGRDTRPEDDEQHESLHRTQQ